MDIRKQPWPHCRIAVAKRAGDLGRQRAGSERVRSDTPFDVKGIQIATTPRGNEVTIRASGISDSPGDPTTHAKPPAHVDVTRTAIAVDEKRARARIRMCGAAIAYESTNSGGSVQASLSNCVRK